MRISTHALTWSATSRAHYPLRKKRFQLTRSRGARLQPRPPPLINRGISTHALTWSATATIKKALRTRRNFNSRAHVERDSFSRWYSSHPVTFQLTRSRGARPDRVADHAVKHHFNSRAHVERDWRLVFSISTTSISTHALTWSATRVMLTNTAGTIFQLTRSRGARRAAYNKGTTIIIISTHALTWSATRRF